MNKVKYIRLLLMILGITSASNMMGSGDMNKQENYTKDWVSEWDIAQDVEQMIVVAANGTTATLSMHNKNADGEWEQILESGAYVGREGIGKTKEGEAKTPIGVYHFTHAFGIKEDPGCEIPYLQVDDSYYWVDDSNSSYYNQFVSLKDVTCDWTSAEHISKVGKAYHYVLALDYNSECVPGLGSAIFLHCEVGKPTAGCVAVPEQTMLQIMQNIKSDCIIVIDSAEQIMKY